MKKTGIFLFVLTLGALVFFFSSQTPPKSEPTQAQTNDEVVLNASISATLALPITVTPPVSGDSIQLIANYSEKKTGQEIQIAYSCDYLVNGGFYTKEETPVAYIKADNQELGRVKDSLLFDGFLSVNKIGTPRITRTLPTDTLVNALQTGPILVENGKQISLSIKNDKEARRVFSLISGENEVMFGIVQSSTLENLPSVVFNWAKENSIHIADAINLDGGSASTYRGANGVFPEISPIGSAFCIKTTK